MKSITDKASTACKKLGSPNESSAAALAKLFGNAGPSTTSRKRPFDPKSECVVATQHSKKKASNQRMKIKTLSVVLLKEKGGSVPKGRSRSKLRECGRIVRLQFKRCMKTDEVRKIIKDGFPGFACIETLQYLRCGQDNILVLNENQDLDGDDIINLAGQGSLYLTQKKVEVTS